MDVFRVRQKLIDDYRRLSAAFVDVRDRGGSPRTWASGCAPAPSGPTRTQVMPIGATSTPVLARIASRCPWST
jgi:hypothetical protein